MPELLLDMKPKGREKMEYQDTPPASGEIRS